MRKPIAVAFFASVFALAGAAGAQSAPPAPPAAATVKSPSSAIDQLQLFLTQTKSARGEFAQVVTGRQGGSMRESSGSFVFQRPGKFRWIYARPYEQVIVGDGEKLYLFDKDLNQVTVKTLAAALPASPASILFGSNKFEQDFDVGDGGRRDGLDWIVAKVKGKDSTFDRIEIGFKDGLPAGMMLKDNFGQTTLLKFSKVERNPALKQDAFEFTPPKGADVLEDR